MRYEAVLFDFDGVLADTEPLHFEAWRDALSPLGIRLDWDFYRSQCIGICDDELLELLATQSNRPQTTLRLRQQMPVKQRLFLAKAEAAPPVPEQVISMIKDLISYRLAVVTSTSRLEVEPVLRAAGILESFQCVICAEDVARHKPDPEPYLEAARRLGIKHGLVVEDSVAGEAAAKAAGFEVLRVASVAEVPRRVRERLGLP